MANTLTNVMQKIISRSIVTFRESAVMPMLVNKDFSADTAKKGDAIDFPVGVPVLVEDVLPGAVPPTPENTAPGVRKLSLNYWRKSKPFYLTQKDMTEIDRNEHFLPLQISESIRSLVNDIHSKIVANYTKIYGAVGDPAFSPFGTAGNTRAATAARGLLNKQLAPASPRYGVLHIDDEVEATNQADFKDADKAGTPLTKMEGLIGRKFGADWLWDNAMPSHDTKAAGTTLVNESGAVAVGATSINIDGFTTKPEAGDIFTIAGDTQQYVVVSSTTLSGTNSVVTFQPPLKVANASGDGNEAVTFVADHRVNLLFHPQCFAYAQRQIYTEPEQIASGEFVLRTDPKSGLSLRLQRIFEYKQTAWEFDVLFGTECIYPEYGVRIAGRVGS